MNLFNKNLYYKNFLIFFYLDHALSLIENPGALNVRGNASGSWGL